MIIPYFSYPMSTKKMILRAPIPHHKEPVLQIEQGYVRQHLKYQLSPSTGNDKEKIQDEAFIWKGCSGKVCYKIKDSHTLKFPSVRLASTKLLYANNFFIIHRIKY